MRRPYKNDPAIESIVARFKADEIHPWLVQEEHTTRDQLVADRTAVVAMFINDGGEAKEGTKPSDVYEEFLLQMQEHDHSGSA